MTDMRPMSNAHIHAYVDGQLKEEREEQLQEYIATHPEKYEQVEEYQLINVRLYEQLGALLDEPIPPSILALSNPTNKSKSKKKPKNKVKDNVKSKVKRGADRIRSKIKLSNKVVPISDAIASSSQIEIEDDVDVELDRDTTSVFSGHNYVGGNKLHLVALLLIGLIGGWFLHDNLDAFAGNSLAGVAQFAVDAHQLYTKDSRHGVEVSVRNSKHLRSWMKSQLKTNVDPVNLEKHGYKLLGGRVLPVKGTIAGQYMYKNKKDKSKLTILVSSYVQDTQNTIPKCKNIELENKTMLNVCGWKKSDLIYYVVTSKPTEEVNILATAIKKNMPKKG